MRAGTSWGSGGTNHTHTHTRTLTPTCCVLPVLPRAVLQLSPLVARANRPVLPVGHVQTRATTGTSAKHLLPGWLPHPCGAGRHGRSQSCLHKADCDRARTSRMVPAGVRHWRGSRRGLGDALITDAQTQQTQPSLVTHPCELTLWCAGRDSPDLSTRQAAGPATTVCGTTYTSASPGFIYGQTRVRDEYSVYCSVCSPKRRILFVP